jgi:hypothetical protein
MRTGFRILENFDNNQQLNLDVQWIRGGAIPCKAGYDEWKFDEVFFGGEVKNAECSVQSAKLFFILNSALFTLHFNS